MAELTNQRARFALVMLLCTSVASPIVKRQKEGGRTFTVTACKFWNSLPLTTRKVATLGSLKNRFG